jgi:hypothetical protein
VTTPGSAEADDKLTVSEAAAQLRLTPQGVRNAISDGRLAALTTVLPNGRRSFDIRRSAIEAFERNRQPGVDERVEQLQWRLDHAIEDLHQKDLRILALERDLQLARREAHAMKAELTSYLQGRLAALESSMGAAE